ncbi:hypothetical protein FZEAL_3005 [Fusarium zealandicum]|uniref:Extracellular protein n=1 Tax=Fusarium zealandicum TaxID=1053134 RepID=A0A8H4XMZ6_9HYPO|nr:hypothetical protein FZEAL_3005 [Fusarium zealandicum]
MRFTASIRLTAATISAFILLFSSLILQTLATPLLSSSSQLAEQEHGALLRRAEQAGAACDSEGQWNCMTSSFQRCASGQWSVEMSMADGTRCSPGGFTDDFNFRIEHDGSVNGQGDGQGDDRGNDGDGNGCVSVGSRDVVQGTTLMVVFGIWAILKIAI